MRLLRRLAALLGRGRGQATASLAPATSPEVAPAQDAGPPPAETPPLRIARLIFDEALATGDRWRGDISGSARWRRLKDDPPELQIAVMRAAWERDLGIRWDKWRVAELKRAMASQVLRRSLPFIEDDLLVLLKAWQAQPELDHGVPGGSLLGAVERYARGAELSSASKQVLERLRVRAAGGGRFGQPPTKEIQGYARRIAKLLDPPPDKPVALPKGEFTKRFENLLASLPERDRPHWLALADLAVTVGDRSSPSRKWQNAAALQLRGLDTEQVRSSLVRLLDDTTPDPARPDDSLDILKGLLWAAAQVEGGGFAGPVGRFAERCFRKVPNLGARSVKLGNAALWALSEMTEDPGAPAELFRLSDKLKRPSARSAIDKRLAELASKTGQTVAQMEDEGLPDYGLGSDGRISFSFGASRIELSLTATGLEQAWFNGAGAAVKTIPAEVRAHHSAELAACRRRVKDIEQARAAQVQRLEQSWLDDRSWRLADWRAHFLGHSLRRPIVQTLIWRIGANAVLPVGDALTDLQGRAQSFSDEAQVTLWHPLLCEPDEVLAWRQRILDLGLTQPIKQAHREIYVLTDAERHTGTYSNRFAAHILRQHQFRALCEARGWSYGLMGGWDSWSVPTRTLLKQGLSVQYQVGVVDDGRESVSGVSLHLTSDQVRFLNAQDEQVELEFVSPVVFSEAMRDVDLFVAVTSVANDPEWAEGGPHGLYAGYWREWGFADLGQSAAARKELVAWIAPKLSIADKLTIDDKFLIVQGKHRKYAIHFGSGNIQMRPSNRYLCIVPDREPREAVGLKLPFTGDRTLSIILSKAFLLVDDDKIVDPQILRQLDPDFPAATPG